MAASLSQTMKDEFELFECKVCLEPILDKKPRTLICNHTFCQVCLTELLHNKTICCPTCRAVTMVTSNDVTNLPLNFDLSKMKEREQELLMKAGNTKSTNNRSFCEICELKGDQVDAEFKCEECISKFCIKCKDVHLQTPAFSQHLIKEFQQKHIKCDEFCSHHQKPIKFVCLHCMEGICLACSFDEKHQSHKNHISSLDKARSIVIESAATFRINLMSKVLELSGMMTTLAVHDPDKRLLDKFEIYNQKVFENMKFQRQKLRKKITSVTDDINRLQKKLNEVFMDNEPNVWCSLRVLSQKEEIEQSFQSLHESTQSVDKLIDSFEFGEPQLEAACKFEKRTFPVPIVPPMGECRLVRMIPRGVLEIKKPVGLIQLDNHDVLVCDKTLSYIQQIHVSGHLVSKYYPFSLSNYCVAMALHGQKLYIANDRGITRLALLNSTMKRHIYLVKARDNIYRMMVTGDENIYVSMINKGVLMKVDSENKTEIVLEDLDEPYYIREFSTQNQKGFILTERGKNRINIYDPYWNLQSYITGPDEVDTLNFPRDICLTEKDTVLVCDANNDRISEYHLDGSFIRHVLTEHQHGIKSPCAISYKYPYLWMTELNIANNKGEIKLFTFE